MSRGRITRSIWLQRRFTLLCRRSQMILDFFLASGPTTFTMTPSLFRILQPPSIAAALDSSVTTRQNPEASASLINLWSSSSSSLALGQFSQSSRSFWSSTSDGTSAEVSEDGGNTPVRVISWSNPRGAPSNNHLASRATSGSSECSPHPHRISALIGVFATATLSGTSEGSRTFLKADITFPMLSSSSGCTSPPSRIARAGSFRTGSAITAVSISSQVHSLRPIFWWRRLGFSYHPNPLPRRLLSEWARRLGPWR